MSIINCTNFHEKCLVYKLYIIYTVENIYNIRYGKRKLHVLPFTTINLYDLDITVLKVVKKTHQMPEHYSMCHLLHDTHLLIHDISSL